MMSAAIEADDLVGNADAIAADLMRRARIAQKEFADAVRPASMRPCAR